MSFEAFTSSELYSLPKDCITLVEQFVRPKPPLFVPVENNYYLSCYVCGETGLWREFFCPDDGKCSKCGIFNVSCCLGNFTECFFCRC